MNSTEITDTINYLKNKGIDLNRDDSKCDDCDQRNETVMYHHDIYPDYQGCQRCYEIQLQASKSLKTKKWKK